MFGKRLCNFLPNITVEDITNGFKAAININPDDRSGFSKLFTSKKTFPDYLVYSLSNI